MPLFVTVRYQEGGTVALDEALLAVSRVFARLRSHRSDMFSESVTRHMAVDIGWICLGGMSMVKLCLRLYEQ